MHVAASMGPARSPLRSEGGCAGEWKAGGIRVLTVNQCLGAFLGDADDSSVSFTVANYEKETTKPNYMKRIEIPLDSP